MAGITVLMVAEKPSISSSIAEHLSGGSSQQRRGVSSAAPVHEFEGQFRGRAAYFRVTSVAGHVYSLDFAAQYRNWESSEPVDLFDAPTQKEEANPKTHICRHLQQEAKGCDYLVLWLDCDKEGENICYEVIQNTVRYLNRRQEQTVFRAKFSAITLADITRAMANLVQPDENQARAVDGRQELDLKIGVAFTRFQTKMFANKYPLRTKFVSYGPCQTPTLGFCVERHDRIASFSPETFWTLQVTIDDGTREGMVKLPIEWTRGRIFDADVATLFHDMVSGVKTAVCTAVTNKEDYRPRPAALHTVEMLRVGSSMLGLSPKHTMDIAEHLYIRGYISYPRTESTRYPDSFDLTGTLAQQRGNGQWGEYVRQLMANGIERPKAGKDMGDHPPITPMRADNGELGGDYGRLYDYICRHFIATVSPDCVFIKTKAEFTLGQEQFTLSGKRIIEPGFTAIMYSNPAEDTTLPETLVANGTHRVTNVVLHKGLTSPPDYLSESELITLMESNGIGTDASIPVHINNICERGYVKIIGGRRLEPTTLGIVLIHGYQLIDPDLCLPHVRSSVEKDLDLVAEGNVSYDAVVGHVLAIFRRKLEYFAQNIAAMDALMEANFALVAESAKTLSRCGKCNRYMKYLKIPPRLHCINCDESYNLPANGTIKVYKELTCPIDGFELVLFSLGAKGKSYPICPHCYKYPPFPGVESAMGCDKCLHPECEHSQVKLAVNACAECPGVVVFDEASGPKWRMHCNLCNVLVMLPETLHHAAVTDEKCGDCGTTMFDFVFHKDHPLSTGETAWSGCIVCDPLINSMIDTRIGRNRHPTLTRGRGRKRGRGRGRGARDRKGGDPRDW